MKSENDTPPNNFGLLSTRSAGCWSVDVDESHDGKEWSLQLDGPQVYIAFAMSSLGVVRSAAEYLRACRAGVNALPLGSFGPAAVSLHWDNECPDRCFLIVAGVGGSAFRVTLTAEDTGMLAEALEQVLDDLPDAQMK